MPLPSGTPAAPATLCLLSSLPPAHATAPPRVRLVGRVVAYDPARALALLADGDQGLLVDFRRVLHHAEPDQAAGTAGAPRVKERWMICGEVLLLPAPLAVPSIAAHLPPVREAAPEVDPRVVLVAERAEECEALEMHGWREAVRAVQAHALAGGEASA
ncbi:hypothetical protein JCM10450v2_002784 [Rhodotorula kratochvilovae]